jgi:hypothetical protein
MAAVCTPNAVEVALRELPNSARIGSKNTPKEYERPKTTNEPRKHPATTHP